MKKISILIIIFIITGEITSWSQDVLFTNYFNTPMQTNPALVAFDNDFKLFLSYKEQFSQLSQTYKTPLLSVVYPLINHEKSQRWGGLGFSVISDMSGNSNMLKTIGANFSFAYNFRLSKTQFVSASLAAGYSRREMNTNNLTTGSQYVPNQGYDPMASINENFINETKGFLDLSTGAVWQLIDNKGFPKSYFGISAFHLNQPDISLNEQNDVLPIRFGIQAGYKVFTNDRISVFPDLGVDYQANIYRYNVGVSISVPFKTYSESYINDASLIFKPRYLSNNSISMGIEFRKPSYVIAFSYDFNVSNNVVNSNIVDGFELYVGFKKTLILNKKPKEKIIIDDKYVIGEERIFNKDKETIIVRDTVYLEDTTIITEKKLSEKLSNPEKKITFRYKSAQFDDDAKKVLDEIVDILNNHTDYILEIEGHTDNIGTAASNIRGSLRRAKSIKAYIVKKGIDKNRIWVSGKGESEPVASNKTEKGRALNRRVEFRLYRIIK